MSILPYLVGAVMCVVGVGLGAGGFASRRRAKAAAAWPTVPGKVSAAEVIVHKESGVNSKGHRVARVSYEAAVKYTYTVEGKLHHGKRVGLADGTGGKAHAEKLVELYGPSTEVQVHYNPADPKDAILDPRENGSGRQFAIGGALLAVGLVVLAYGPMLAGLFAF
ncbi:DUF3592 domain-containing protein [bacterium]|nr:DUF3592 domain-containing protein [bacterium]